jgi:uncharacterized protein (DUF302 family)
MTWKEASTPLTPYKLMNNIMSETTYGYSTSVNYDFDTALQKVTNALKEQGFGIMTTINVKAKMKEKIDQDMEEYVILGACNPKSAFKVLQEEIEIGLLLPCNVIVYNKNGKTHVSAIRPTQAIRMIDNPALEETAREIEEKLKQVINQL